MNDKFDNYPQSVTEIKSINKNDGRIWTPRDLLIDMLRRIDKGDVNPTAIVICYQTKDEKGVGSYYSLSTPDLATALGLMERAKYLMNESA